MPGAIIDFNAIGIRIAFFMGFSARVGEMAVRNEDIIAVMGRQSVVTKTEAVHFIDPDVFAAAPSAHAVASVIIKPRGDIDAVQPGIDRFDVPHPSVGDTRKSDTARIIAPGIGAFRLAESFHIPIEAQAFDRDIAVAGHIIGIGQ